MENLNKNNFNLKSEDLIVFAWEKRRPLIIITTFAFVITSIITLLIPNLYKSTVILYPVTTSPVAKYLFTDQYASSSIIAFGDEEDSEQLLQILSSNRLKYKIINKYNLYKHYKIPENHKFKKTLVLEKYDKYIKARRTKLRSLIVEVLDFDPDTAALIANDIALYIDSVIYEIKKERAEKLMSIIEKEYFDYINYVQALEDSLEVYNRMGMFDYELQTQALTEAYGRVLSMSNYKAAEEIKKKLDLFEKYGGRYHALSLEYKNAKDKLSFLRTKYNEAKVELMAFVPQKYLVDKAIKPEKKAYPKRTLIVLQAVVGVFIFSFLVFFINEKIIKKNK